MVVAVLSVVGSATAGAVAYRKMAQLTRRAGVEHGKFILDTVSLPLTVKSWSEENRAEHDRFVAALVETNAAGIQFLAVVGPDGEWVATSHGGMVEPPQKLLGSAFVKRALRSPSVQHAFGPDTARPAYVDVARPILQNGQRATLLARASLSSFDRELENLRLTVVAVCSLAALVGWLVTVLLLERLVVKPVGDLAEMAQRLGEGELDIRVSPGRRDELGDLSRALNTMARKLAHYTTQLETVVQERTADLESANRELERLATTDGLTGLKNHRYFQETLEQELKRARRHPHPLTLLMVDIDHFKLFNDTHGHPDGDNVLRGVAHLLQHRLRSTDLVARYGGEEFAVVLLDTDATQGTQTAHQLTRVVRETTFVGGNTQPMGRITVSIGVAAYPEDADSREHLIRRADLALYEAKRRGRDGVIRWSEQGGEQDGSREPPAPEP